MPSISSPLTSSFAIIELLIKLFTIGIHSSEEGPKAWFETLAVTATLMACGYLLWYQGILIILALIFGAMAAGMFVFLAPAYTIQNNIATKTAVNALKTVSIIKKERINHLTGNKLIKETNCQVKAINELKQNFPNLIQEFPEFAQIFETITQGAKEGSKKADVEKQKRASREQEEQKQRVEAERKLNEQRTRSKKEWTRREQEEQRQQEVRERTLNDQRARAGEFSGHPPDPNNPKHPPLGYPIKVTKNLTKERYKGIYYRPNDYDYWDYDAAWWFESEAHVPKHKYRRPYRKGRSGGLRE
ncbi:hypothetical protein NDA03_12680 [Trichocoleus sp. Lan]|uniref:hypothetical protein n=1 Tax=Trichocoleus sp. Lan TaxID=2933927 RepID=UPI003298A926